ncbi:MAG: peptidoglycan recognition family protein [Candidatus Parcubacteria bacterium]|nr:peptidoglycan recognition family protein [Candidatus Parcubacteria bacterium]
MKKPTSIMIHHTAVSYKFNFDQFEANNSYHKNKWNFKSSLGFYLGYNYEISSNGFRRQARKDGEVTAACYQKDMNDGRCLHIALDGNFDLEKPTNFEIYALRDFLKLKCKQYNILSNQIYFHRQFASKTCPGKNMDLNFIRGLA